MNGGVLIDGKLEERHSTEVVSKYGCICLYDPATVKDFQSFEINMKYEPLNINVVFGAYFISTSVYERVLKKVGFENIV